MQIQAGGRGRRVSYNGVKDESRAGEMTTTEATAEVFWTAFMALGAKERNAFLERLVADRKLREDLLDAAVIEERKQERTYPFSQVLAEARKRRTKRAK